ncbi:MAG: OmpA family protein [Myxococcales bacterium]|nr:OmpA family protein [Myxococcales bacterium]
MRSSLLVSCAALLGLSCSHPQNPERKDPLTDQVTGALQPTDRVFFKDDPATRVACRADAQCPQGALCHPERRVCFTSYPEMELTKIEGSCPLVPLYFAYDSTDLVPEAQRWVDYDARCLKERGARGVELEGYADARGDASYNAELSRRRAEVVKAALAQRALGIDVAIRGAGESTLIRGKTEHDYAYNRRVELEPK